MNMANYPSVYFSSAVGGLFPIFLAMALSKSNPSGTFGFSGNLTTDRRGVHFDVPPDRLALGPANVGHLLGVGRTAHWQDANRMAIGNHALHPVLSFRAEARPHHDLSTGEVLPSDPRCFIPQADEGARATAPTRPDHFPAPSFPTTDRWCYKHRRFPLSFVCSQPRPSRWVEIFVI